MWKRIAKVGTIHSHSASLRARLGFSYFDLLDLPTIEKRRFHVKSAELGVGDRGNGVRLRFGRRREKLRMQCQIDGGGRQLGRFKSQIPVESFGASYF